MASFSPSDAALEGFQVLGRRWRLVVGWAGFNLIAMVALVVVTTIVAASAVLVAGGDSAAVGASVAAPIVSLATIAVQFVIGVAVYRSIFRPDERGFLYLRIGPDEARCLAAALISMLGA